VTAGGPVAPASAVLAHGVGSREDLPLPFGLTVAGAVVAIVVTAVVVALLRREPQSGGGRPGRPLPSGVARLLDLRLWRWLWAGLGLLGFGVLVAALALGSRGADNPAPWVVYVLLWVGVVPLSVLLGPVYRWLNPVRTLHALVCRAARLDPADGVAGLPPRLGWWPGAVGLLAFVWLELVAPDGTSVPVLSMAVALHVAVQLLGGFTFGARWFERGDPFEVWSGLFGRLAPVARRDDGRWVLRSPLASLDAEPPAPGLVAVVAVMLGSTGYDSLHGATSWVAFVQSGPLPRLLLETLGLLAVVLLVGALLAVATRMAGAAPAELAPSVVPIALGYVVAHYWSFLVLEGQTAFIRLSDPLGTGADLLGLAGRAADPTLADVDLVAAVQVVAIVTGHVLGVVLAHERSVHVLPRTRRAGPVVRQLPLLVLMVVYTVGGLLLLFST